MTATILLIVALLVAALVLFAAEVCTPMFGLLAAAALVCLGWVTYLVFGLNQAMGVITVVLLLVLMPVYLWAMVRYLPRTAIGRKLQLRAERKKAGEGTPETAEQEALVGRVAVAETTLRPSGAIRVDGKRVIATAEAGFIEQGAKVRILRAVGMNVVVREVPEAG